jgi:hypothetical protein
MPRSCQSGVFIFALGFFLFLFLLLFLLLFVLLFVLLLFPLVPRRFGVTPFEPQTWPAIKLFRRAFILPFSLPAFILILIMILRFLAIEELLRDRRDRRWYVFGRTTRDNSI